MRSMTGFGAGKVTVDGWQVTADLKTVNHRFLDLGLRLPRNLSFLEQPVREEIAGNFSRGHVDVFITVGRAETARTSQVFCDPELAAMYFDAAAEIAERTGAENDMTAGRLMSLEGVVSLCEPDMDENTVTEACREAVRTACLQVAEMRRIEGDHLKEHLSALLEQAAKIREAILSRAPLVVREYREKLENRLALLVNDGVDQQRIAQEVAIIADRCSVDEELARLGSHFSQMRLYLESEGEIGKKMDFLVQEMNREANTIGSKASDARIAQNVVDLKSEIEKMREQIQNVE